MPVVTTGMREKRINNMEQFDGEEWRRKIELQAQKNVKTLKKRKTSKFVDAGNKNWNEK